MNIYFEYKLSDKPKGYKAFFTLGKKINKKVVKDEILKEIDKYLDENL